MEMNEEDKLLKLKKMLIGCIILNEISDDEWREYVSKNDNEWIQTEGLKILFSEEVMEMIENKSEEKFRDIFLRFISWPWPYRLVQHSLVQMCTFVSERVYSDCEQWNRHRMVCGAAKWLLKRCEKELSEETFDCLVSYLAKLIGQWNDSKIIQWIILTFEKWWVKINLNSSTKCQLVDALRSHASYLSQVNITSDYEHVDLERYPVAWCAKWTIENVLENEVNKKSKQMPLVKLSHDRCEVRNDTDKSIPVCSSFAVTFGVYYYEVIPLTDGEMRFGWATRELDFRRGMRIGNNDHSIGMEIWDLSCCIYNSNKQISKSITYQPRSVIGCLIDIENRQFKFYINGEEIEMTPVIKFSTQKYYATANLSASQHCLFNFGQAPFKYPPNDVQFNEYIKSCQLAETDQYSEFFWFAHPVIDNRADLFYDDHEQRKYDETVRQLEHFEYNQTTRLDPSVECCRLVQSIIEVVGRRLTCDHTDLLTRWVTEVIEHSTVVERVKLHELLYPYFQQSFNSTIFRNVSFIMIILYFRDYDLKDNLIENTDIFFSQTLKIFVNFKTFLTNPWIMIYVLNCLLRPTPLISPALLNDPFLMSTLNWCSELFGHVSSVSQLYEPSYDFLRLQAGMCARLFRDNVLKSRVQHFPSRATLNPNDMSEHIKLSSDCLSARNDHCEWQYVRSVCPVSSDIFFYETVLMTEGKMWIGWTSKQYHSLIGPMFDLHEYSIGFDGSGQQEIHHREKNFYCNSLIPRWSVGDVVGCLIDWNKKTYKFYLNGKLMICKEKSQDESVFISGIPYYAAVRLHGHQQCYLNFGQALFKYPPKDILFGTLCDISELRQTTYQYQYEFPLLSECYSLVQVLGKNQIELVFDDDKQTESDDLARQIELDISNNKIISFKSENSNENLRIIQSIIEVTEKCFIDKKLYDHASWISHLIHKSTSSNPAFPDLVAQLLYPYFTLHLTKKTVSKHRNVCFVLAALITEMKNFKARVNFHRQVLAYLTEIVTSCQQSFDEYIMIAMIILGNMNLEQEERKYLLSHSKFCNIIEFKRNIDLSDTPPTNPNFSIIHQIVLLSQWTFDRFLKSNKEVEHKVYNHEVLDFSNYSVHIKLLSDRLSARSDQDWQSVRSISLPSSNRHFFEVTLVTSGPMRVGWAAEKVDLKECILGDDKYSIAFDGHNRCIWHRGRQFSKALFNIPQWNVGDVVGCMILTEQKRIAFYLNGKLIPMSIFLPSLTSDQMYYPAASLSTFEQCRFNFVPTNYPLNRNHTLLCNEQIDLMFEDKDQATVDQTVKQIEREIKIKANYPFVDGKLEFLRIIQSFIEVSGKQLTCDRLNVVMEWTDQMVQQSATNSTFLNKFFQLLYPYITLHLVSTTTSKHRNVCIFMSSLIKTMPQLPIYLRELSVTYLVEIVSNSDKFSDELLLIITMIVLGNMDLNEEERNKLKSNEKLCNALKQLSSPDLNDITILAKLSIIRQVELLSQWTLDHLLNLNQKFSHSSLTNHETLDFSKCSANLKLSSDLLSARSDRNWQSVRSRTSISSKRYYYEVTLATSGPMRFGWAAENVDLTMNKLGDDEYSIGFDGHNRCVWHRGKQYLIRNRLQEWTAGDVVGCMILMKEKRFAFYLNSKLIQMPLLTLFVTPYFSEVQSYYAAASLFTFQQSQFNFSVAKYPPRRPSFRVLDSLRNSIDRGFRPIIVNTGNVINSLFNVAGRIEAGNITPTYINGNHSKDNFTFIPDRSTICQSEQLHDQVFDEHEEDALSESVTKHD